jgi:hypothetical protein
MPTASEGGLGSALVGDKIMINARQVLVTKLLGEGTITRGNMNAAAILRLLFSLLDLP